VLVDVPGSERLSQINDPSKEQSTQFINKYRAALSNMLRDYGKGGKINYRETNLNTLLRHCFPEDWKTKSHWSSYRRIPRNIVIHHFAGTKQCEAGDKSTLDWVPEERGRGREGRN
jgi:hypothetical protein